MITERSLYSSPPPDPNVRSHNNPTLLYSWWCTGTAVVIILFRLTGRLVRNNMLFREDKIMFASLIPLLIRMAFIHPVLLWGTNNAADTAVMSQDEVNHRSIASRLVLGARIFYALYIWTAKFTISEFLKRMISSMWTRGHELTLRGIRIFLAVAFVAVLIATLTECHPVSHYWQVVPDPGPHCRQGYAQLITMGTADIITDVLLVLFPIPVVITSHFHWKRKASLVLLFSMSIILIVITALRVPSVISHKGLQQYRTVWASSEILAATAISNAIVLGSFLRDRGVKKAKYKPERILSRTESNQAPSSRRPTFTQQHYGSDEDLFRDVGCRIRPDPDLEAPRPRLAKPVAPPSESDESPLKDGANWHFPGTGQAESGRDSEENDDLFSIDLMPSPTDVRGAPRDRRVSFLDGSGSQADEETESRSSTVGVSPTSSSSARSRPFISSLTSYQRPTSDLSTHTASLRSPPLRSNNEPPPRGILRRYDSNTPPLQDIGGLAPPENAGNSMELHDIGGLLPPSNAGDELLDVGGLLNPPPRERIDSHLSPATPQTQNLHLPRPHLPRLTSNPSSSGSRS